ncbi:L-ascorbate oxidase [Tanacetum coccineum]
MEDKRFGTTMAFMDSKSSDAQVTFPERVYTTDIAAKIIEIVLARTLDSTMKLHMADGLLINGRPSSTSFIAIGVYMFRVSNVALTTSVNFRTQAYTLTLVDTEGSHTLQEADESFDIHVGQSASFLVKLHAPVKDYFIAYWSHLSDSLVNETCQNNQVYPNSWSAILVSLDNKGMWNLRLQFVVFDMVSYSFRDTGTGIPGGYFYIPKSS